MKIDSKNPPSIKSFSTASTYILSFTSIKVFCAMLGYVGTVMKDFFGIQFLRKFRILKTPILNVETELDKRLPFVPENIADYLGFVNFWIRPLAMLAKILGRKKSVPLLAEFFTLLKISYKEAATIYRYCMTTTDRPRYNKKAYFVMVHIFDPHYLCVPSLHIAVVSLCYAFFRSVLQSQDFSSEQRELWTREIYEGAVKIAETVLYVKQHSVNCIPAALYMMTKIIPQYFSANDAQKFLGDMFAARGDIEPALKQEAVLYMQNLFAEFHNQAALEWNAPIKAWMREHAQKTGQKTLAF